MIRQLYHVRRSNDEPVVLERLTHPNVVDNSFDPYLAFIGPRSLKLQVHVFRVRHNFCMSVSREDDAVVVIICNANLSIAFQLAKEMLNSVTKESARLSVFSNIFKVAAVPDEPIALGLKEISLASKSTWDLLPATLLELVFEAQLALIRKKRCFYVTEDVHYASVAVYYAVQMMVDFMVVDCWPALCCSDLKTEAIVQQLIASNDLVVVVTDSQTVSKKLNGFVELKIAPAKNREQAVMRSSQLVSAARLLHQHEDQMAAEVFKEVLGRRWLEVLK